MDHEFGNVPDSVPALFFRVGAFCAVTGALPQFVCDRRPCGGFVHALVAVFLCGLLRLIIGALFAPLSSTRRVSAPGLSSTGQGRSRLSLNG